VTQVDFYVLEDDSEDARLRVACRIVDKATQQDQHVFINAASDAEAAKLDDLLWTFSQGSFIPHKVVREAAALQPLRARGRSRRRERDPSRAEPRPLSFLS
jgi:DNA polymerase-3 subunit chi